MSNVVSDKQNKHLNHHNSQHCSVEQFNFRTDSNSFGQQEFRLPIGEAKQFSSIVGRISPGQSSSDCMLFGELNSFLVGTPNVHSNQVCQYANEQRFQFIDTIPAQSSIGRIEPKFAPSSPGLNHQPDIKYHNKGIKRPNDSAEQPVSVIITPNSNTISYHSVQPNTSSLAQPDTNLDGIAVEGHNEEEVESDEEQGFDYEPVLTNILNEKKLVSMKPILFKLMAIRH